MTSWMSLLILAGCGGGDEPGADPRLDDEPEDVVPCDGSRDVPEPTADQLAEATAAECQTHADCTAGLHGRCVVDFYAREVKGETQLVCSYDDCDADEDCDAASICICENDRQTSRSFCVPADCRTDADCGGGARCRVEEGSCGVRETGRYCTTDDDTCDSVEDICPDDETSKPVGDGTCVHLDGQWQCGFQGCYD